MQARNEIDLCRDVLSWLKAACTARGGGGLQNGVPVVYHPLASVILPEAVYRYLTSKVQADLPALGAPDAATGALAGTLTGRYEPSLGRQAVVARMKTEPESPSLSRMSTVRHSVCS